MTTWTTEHPTEAEREPDEQIPKQQQTFVHLSTTLVVIAATLFGFGIMMLLISSAYVRDLETLQRVPEAVWQFVCGVPSENPMIFPMLITMGGGSLIIGAVLLVVNHWLKKRRAAL